MYVYLSIYQEISISLSLSWELAPTLRERPQHSLDAQMRHYAQLYPRNKTHSSAYQVEIYQIPLKILLSLTCAFSDTTGEANAFA